MYAAAKSRARRWDPTLDLFPPQRAYVKSKAKRKAAFCTRRAGKSTAIARDHYDTAAATPGVICPYFGVTMKVARRTMWPEFTRLNAEHDLGLKMDRTNLEITLPNTSQIWICGAKDENEIEKARGFKFAKVSLDEAASYRHDILKRLVDEIIEPALMDLNGVLALAGTPGRRLAGLFYEVTRPELAQRQRGWDVHEWSVLDNPHVPSKEEQARGHTTQQYIEDLKERRGWTEQTPQFLREYRKRWVRSDDELIYHYDATENDFDELPAGEDWHYVLGIDVGNKDSFALVLLAYSVDSRTAYIVETVAKPNLDVTDMAEEIKLFQQNYRLERLVMDCGALGLTIAEELRRRHQLPIQAAEKTEKRAFIKLMNSDLQRGYLKASSDNEIVREEWETLQWTDNDKEDPTQHNDMSDAALYAWRYARNYMPRDKGPGFTDPNDARWNDHEKKLEREVARQRRQKDGWWG